MSRKAAKLRDKVSSSKSALPRDEDIPDREGKEFVRKAREKLNDAERHFGKFADKENSA